MSIFNTAIKTLSDIAIQESSVVLPTETKTSLVEEVQEMLSDIPSLKESEMVFDVRMVPVVANSRFNKYLIEMEDISRYMITNKISSLREAIGNILECNDLEGEFNHVALVIDESSILSEMEDLGICCCDDKDYPENTNFNKVGKTSFGSQDNMKYIRRLANSKQLLDTLYNNYGIPFIKKNYNQVGLLKEEAQYAEDVAMQKKDKEKVLHEKDVNDDESYSETSLPDDMNPTSTNNTVNRVGPNSPSSKVIPKPNTTNPSNKPMTESDENDLQYLRDVASGKYDEF